MSEITIAQPLSGSEVVNRIVEKIRTMLHQDCFLNAYSAYESFEADIKIDLKMLDCGRTPEVHARVIERSETPLSEDFALEHADAHLGAQPPNQVRMESGQPIPTLVNTGDGRPEIRPVRYARRPVPPPLGPKPEPSI